MMSESTINQADRARPARPARPQAVLTVLHREWLSPHAVRVTAGGDGFEALRMNDFTDKYAKILFVDPGLGLTPPYDLAALRESLPPDRQPVTRTYTLRWADVQRREVAIDFVVHGDEGIAAPWAAQAKPGDILTLSGAGGAYRPDPFSDWHLLAGDESALPAICSALDALPGDARGLAYLETCDPGEQLDATVPAGVEVVWLHRPQPGSQPRLLADTLLAGPWLSGRADVFAHGERESMKAVRSALATRLGDGDQMSLSGYWAAGRTEDVFQSEKRQPIGQL
jgi:NADPH-dependent ferric siderophore reductase